VGSAMYRTEGAPRPFGPLEIAGAKHVHDVTPAELLERPDHPKIHGRRPILCACGCSVVGIHNARASRRRQTA
jgi:hypothetical protein